jgi:hypothetical protein
MKISFCIKHNKIKATICTNQPTDGGFRLNTIQNTKLNNIFHTIENYIGGIDLFVDILKVLAKACQKSTKNCIGFLIVSVREKRI